MPRTVACSPQKPFRILSSAQALFNRVHNPGPTLLRAPSSSYTSLVLRQDHDRLVILPTRFEYARQDAGYADHIDVCSVGHIF